MKNKVVILGSYGCGNAGDNSILSGIINNLGRENFAFSVFCDDEQYIRDRFDVQTIRHIISQGVSLKAISVFFTSFIKALKKIANCDMLLIGGGSIIHDLKFYNLPYYFIYHFIAKLFKKKVVYFGVSIGPINTWIGSYLCRIFLNKADCVCVRDRASCELLDRIGVGGSIISVDQAFEASMDFNPKVVSELMLKHNLKDKQFISMTVCGWFKSTNFWDRNNMDFSKELDFFRRVISDLIERYDFDVVFIPTVYPHDVEVAIKIRSLLDRNKRFIILDEELDYADIVEMISKSYLLLGMRLHSMIFAAIKAVPFYSILYDRKVEAFLQLIGMDENASSLEDLNVDEVKVGVQRVVDNYHSLSELLRRISEEFYEIGRQTGYIVKELLTYES